MPRHRQPRVAHRRPCFSGFTLVELIAVLGILVMLVAVLAPSLSVSRPAGSAILQLKTTLHRARSEAIRYRTDTFVAFTDSLPGIEGNNATDAYRYRAYAIFIRDTEQLDPRNRYLDDVLTCPVRQVTNWSLLPEDVLFALGEDIQAVGSGATMHTLLDTGDPEGSLGFRGSAYREFPLRIERVDHRPQLPCIAFNREGRVRLPSWHESRFLHLGLVSGRVRDGRRTITNFVPRRSGTSGPGKPVPDVELLTIGHATGLVREVGTTSHAGGGSP